MSRTQLFIFMGLAILVLIAGLVIFGPGRRPAAPREASLTFWGIIDDERAWQDVIREFKKKNPHLEVTYQRFDEDSYESVLVNRLAEGKGPDIFMLKNSWAAKHRDKIIPLNAVFQMTRRDMENSFVDEVADTLVTRDGKILGMPIYLDTLLLFYNKDIFNAAGIALPPQTWEEVEAVSRTLTQSTPAGDIIRSGIALGSARKTEHAFEILAALILQKGSEIVDRNTGEVKLGSPAEEALRFYSSFADISGNNYSWRDGARSSLEAFAEGNAAMAIGFSSDISRIRARNPHLNLGVSALPQPKDARVPIVYPRYFFLTVSKLSPNPGPAWQFALFASSEEGAKIYLENIPRPPARRDLISAGTPNPELDASYRQTLTARSFPVPDEEIVVRRVFIEAIDSVNTRARTPAQAITRLQQQLRLLLP